MKICEELYKKVRPLNTNMNPKLMKGDNCN